jgi:hypothetical protein
MANDPPEVFGGVGNLLSYRYRPNIPPWVTPYRLTSDQFVMMGRRPGDTIEQYQTSTTNVNVALSTPAWTMTALTDHWSTPKLRGNDAVVPGGFGELSQRRQVGANDISITLAIVGDYRPDGTRNENVGAGLARNVEEIRQLQTNLYRTYDPLDTYLSEFYYVDMAHSEFTSIYWGIVQVERIRFARTAENLVTASLSLTAAKPFTVTTNAPARTPTTRTAWQ